MARPHLTLGLLNGDDIGKAMAATAGMKQTIDGALVDPATRTVAALVGETSHAVA